METNRHLRQETVHALEELIRVNLDSYRNLALVNEASSDERLTALFRRIADQRKEFATELGLHVLDNDGELSPRGHFLEELHRWWVDITGKLERGNVQAVLEEAARGEAALEAVYARIMTESAGSAVSDVLGAQYRAINESSRRIHDLLDKVKNG